MFHEMPFPNFYSNRNKADFTWQLQEIFEFSLIRTKYNAKIDVTRAWSVTIKDITIVLTTIALKVMQLFYIYR